MRIAERPFDWRKLPPLPRVSHRPFAQPSYFFSRPRIAEVSTVCYNTLRQRSFIPNLDHPSHRFLFSGNKNKIEKVTFQPLEGHQR